MLEGFYGNPWTHEQRLELLAFMASRGMNTFVYAPKDDPRMRRDWRSAYVGPDLRRLNELVNRSRAAGIELMFCVSPGLTMRYSDEEDLEALCDKLGAVEQLGVASFGLLFDDIPTDLQHPEDREAFDTLADAHVAVANQVYERLERGTRLTVCPTVYSGGGTEPYLATLGAGLEPGIDVFWTGRADVLRRPSTSRDAATFERTARAARDLLGQLPRQRCLDGLRAAHRPVPRPRPHLFRHAFGVVANGMELFEASKIPIATIADYLMAPETYDPEKSWRRAIRDVAGDADLEAFALFADNVRSSCLAAEDAPALTAALQSFAFRTDQGDGASAAADLGLFADRLLAAAAHLLRGPVENRALIDECRPWIEAFEVGAQALRLVATLASDLRLERDGPGELRPYLVRLREARVRVFGDVLDMALAELTGTMVRPGRPTLEAAD